MTDVDRIVPLDPTGSGAPLYCVHSSSGSAYSYLGLAQLLDRPVYGIEAPGFDGVRDPVRSVSDLSAEYVDVLREVHPDGPYLLLGWSMGGIIALDMARRLTGMGATVPVVVLVDVSVSRVAPLPPEKDIVRRFLHEILATMEVSPPDTLLTGLPDGAPSGELLEAAAGVLPPELDAELLTERYTVFRALVEASYGFAVSQPYRGSVVHVIASESKATESRSGTSYLDWSAMAPALTEYTVTGTHHSIWSSALPELAKMVDASITDPPGRPIRSSGRPSGVEGGAP